MRCTVKHNDQLQENDHVEIGYCILFFVISIIAGFFGFTNIAAGAKGRAKVLFFIALVVFLIGLVFGVLLGVLAC